MISRLVGSQIAVSGDTYPHRDWLGSVPGGHWHRGTWLYPGTPVAAATLFWRTEPDDAVRHLAEQQVERGDRLAAVRGGDGPPPSPAGGLWHHQRAGVWVASVPGGVLLDYGMRSGKTRITLEVLRACRYRRSLVVCPLKVIDTWGEEADKHGIPVEVLGLRAGSVARRARTAKDFLCPQDDDAPRVVVINYEAVWREPFGGWAMEQPWQCLVLDEVHRCQQPSGKASRYLARLAERVPHRIGLSGTPIGDGPINAYGVFRALDPGVYGRSFAQFKQRYIVEREIQPGVRIPVGLQNEREFTERYHLITLKGDRAASDMPDESDSTLHCDLPPAAAKVYRGMRDELVAELRGGTVTAANALVRVTKLHQLAAGHVKHEDGRTEDVHHEKDALLAEALDELGPTEPLVVYGWYVADLARIRSVAESAGRACLEISGRRDDLAAWKRGEGSVIAVQIQAGGVGVDLSRACYAVFWTTCFSHPLYRQARARVLGQQRPVAFIHLVARGTVDAAIYRALATKGDLLDRLLADPGELMR